MRQTICALDTVSVAVAVAAAVVAAIPLADDEKRPRPRINDTGRHLAVDSMQPAAALLAWPIVSGHIIPSQCQPTHPS